MRPGISCQSTSRLEHTRTAIQAGHSSERNKLFPFQNRRKLKALSWNELSSLCSALHPSPRLKWVSEWGPGEEFAWWFANDIDLRYSSCCWYFLHLFLHTLIPSCRVLCLVSVCLWFAARCKSWRCRGNRWSMDPLWLCGTTRLFWEVLK